SLTSSLRTHRTSVRVTTDIRSKPQQPGENSDVHPRRTAGCGGVHRRPPLCRRGSAHAPAAGVPVPALGEAGLLPEEMILPVGHDVPHADRNRPMAARTRVRLLRGGHSAHPPGTVPPRLTARHAPEHSRDVELRMRLVVRALPTPAR